MGATTVVFVGGMGRSGSTLVARAMGQLPGLVTAGELHYLWDQGVLADRACACGEVFSDCSFWRDVGDEAFGGWNRQQAMELLAIRKQVVRNRNVALLASPYAPAEFTAARNHYVAAMARTYRAIAVVSGADGVVDTSKYPGSAFVLRGEPAIDLRLVHLVRRSEGVAWSWMKRVVRPDRDGSEFARFPPARTAAEWLAYNLAYDLLRLASLPSALLRYEDFVTDPAAALRSTMESVGWDGKESLDFIRGARIEMRAHHSIAGNPMRFRTGWEEVLADEAWRSDMPRAARRVVSALSFPGLLRFGYLGRQRS